MEKETKRTFQKMIEIIQEQQRAIQTLQHNAIPSSRTFKDGLADRIERIAEEIGERESFEVDWRRLCDRHYAARS
jgi:hypothetical protein